MKYIIMKMPNGKIVRLRPIVDDLLSEFDDLTLPSIDKATAKGNHEAISEQDDYSTDNFDVRLLAGAPVAFFGAGSVGGYILYFTGHAKLISSIFDCKHVLPKHTRGARTIYDYDLVGLKKVHAAQKKIEHAFPGAIVKPYACNIADLSDDELKHLFANVLVIIIAIDDPEQMLRLSKLAYPIVECIQVAMHTGGQSGHIAISIPYVTPCLRCTLDITDSSQITRLDGERANSWDVMAVAHMAARIAIDIMYSKVTGQSITRWDPSKNLIYIANAKQELSPDGPGIHYEDSQRRPGCPICNYRR
jgi:hypothetical protein